MTRRQSWRFWAVAVASPVLFCLLRVLVAGHGSARRLVLLGRVFADVGHLPYLMPFATDPTGYDGQFYWRLALNPTHWSTASYLGVHLDSAFRLNRVAYPALAWVLSLGQRSLVPVGLLAVNVLALVVLAGVGRAAARRAGLRAWWGLTLWIAPGLVGALSRDLTDAVMTVAVVAFIVSYRRGWWWRAAAALSVAVLSRETALLVVLIYAAASALEVVRRQRRLALRDLAWFAPLVIEVGWQVLVHHALGVWPLRSSSGSGDLGLPLVGILTGVPHWFTSTSLRSLARAALDGAQSVAAFTMLILAWSQRRRVVATELAVVAVFALLFLAESAQGWRSPFDARYATLPMTLTALHVLEVGSPRARRVVLVVGVPVLVLTALWRVAVL